MVYFDEDQIEKWVTINGARTPILKDGSIGFSHSIDADFNTKQRQLDASSDLRKAFKQLEAGMDAAHEKQLNRYVKDFTDKTGVGVSNVGAGNVKNCDAETIKEAFDSLAEATKKYGVQNFELDIYSNEDMTDKDGNSAYASVNGTIEMRLNEKYYGMAKEDLAKVYATDVERWYHPQGTTSKDILVHELAHLKLNKQVAQMSSNLSSYENAQEYLIRPNGGNYKSDFIVSRLKARFGKVEQQYKDYLVAEGVMENPGRWTLLQLVNPDKIGKTKYALSRYAATNYHEVLAEALADYNANGDNARVISKLLLAEFFNMK